MNELHYQLDLMRAINQKLSDREKMYRLLCDTMDYAYIYYSFEKNSVTTLGKWDDFFDFQIRDRRDFTKLLEMVDEHMCCLLGICCFGEGRSGNFFCGMHAEGEEDLAAVLLQDIL